jgi:peptidoglycan hydrolase-like protein with peptidoglycan-binding domain
LPICWALRAGPEDGVLGPRTQRSILLFQKLEKIKEDGKITDELRTKLRERHGL